jgi:hypothetical protein
MKIQVVKQASTRVNVRESCPWLLEVPPEPTKK